MSRLLLYLPALACPLLMLVCMVGMRPMGTTPAHTPKPPLASTTERIAHLEQELAALRAEHQHTGEGPVTGREVVDQPSASRPVVYTTVLTVMDRLARKGILQKRPTGKAHTYQAVQSREAYTARRMASLLGTGGDPTAVLLRFVEQLPPEHAARLRTALQPERGRNPHPPSEPT